MSPTAKTSATTNGESAAAPLLDERDHPITNASLTQKP